MKHLFFFVGLLSAGLVLLSGCSKKREYVSRIEISPAIRTRVSGLFFEKGDQIGLTVLKGGESYALNTPLTYDGSLFSDPGVVWYDDSQQPATLTAYYPYSVAGTPETFSVELDQRSGCDDSDLLGAVAAGIVPASTPIAMLFYHLMTQLTVVVDNSTAADVTGVTVGGFIPTATVDLSVPTASAKSGVAAAGIQAFEVTPGEAYRVILVPQQGDLSVTVETSDGKTSSKSISGALLESGKRYDLSVKITTSDLDLPLSGEISDWEEGGSLDTPDGSGGTGNVDDPDDPDDSDDPDDPESGTLVYDGVTYPTVRIGDQVWMAANLRYRPDNLVLEKDFWEPEDGLSSDPELGLLYTYATATAGVSYSGSPVQGICPDGWHIPNAAELRALSESPECGSGFLKCAGFTIVTVSMTRYGDSDQGYLMSSELSEVGNCHCLHYSVSSEPSMASLSVDFGLSVRCVQD